MSGCCRWMVRVASVPSITGMRTSMRMTSGRRRSAMRTAWLPFSAIPATVIPSLP